MTGVDLAAEVALAVRLLGAAALGAVVGLEREVHRHPAGMRTHLLVAVGAAGFTVLSLAAFDASGSDPGRVAAQIVTGVGFLGAGAILKEGATVRGLTTAASLWAVAAIGMATGAGAWWVALALTAIVVLSLWPLRHVAERIADRDRHLVRLRLVARRLDRLEVVVAAAGARGGAVVRLATERASTGDGATVVELDLRVTAPGQAAAIIAAVAAVDGIELAESTSSDD